MGTDQRGSRSTAGAGSSSTVERGGVEGERSRREEVAHLQAELDALHSSSSSSGGRAESVDAQKLVAEHIALVHEYNGVKDAAQTLFGRIAVMDQTTSRAIHERFGMGTGPDD